MSVSVFVACHTVDELPAVLVDDVGHGQADRHPAQQDHSEAEPVQIKVTRLKVFLLNPDKLRVGVFHKMIYRNIINIRMSMQSECKISTKSGIQSCPNLRLDSVSWCCSSS